MRLGTAFVLSAPSGAGKTTLAKRLLKEFPDFGYSISCTTRPPRPGEQDGRDYHFLTVDEFCRTRDAGGLAEWARVHGNFYGTPLAPLRDLLARGRDVLLDVDVQGAAQLRLSLPDACLVFVLPPSLEELERRLRGRGTDAGDVIEKRLANARGEIAEGRWFDYVLVNDDLERAYDRLRALYLASTQKTSLNRSLLDGFLS